MISNYDVSFAALALLLTACTHAPVLAPTLQAPQTLPIAHSNNAVALAEGVDGPALYSFNGLTACKINSDTSHQAFACPFDQACRQLEDVPVAEGRLASTAITVANTIYLFGGYSVAEDGTEVSTPETLAFDPITEEWTRRADMPTPVDDAVAFAYQDRYIYLVSGWHDDGNVSAVQVYDTQEDAWFRATDYPGALVFGHSGGMVDGKIVIADGVAVTGMVDGKRQFSLIDEAWIGSIDLDDPSEIRWAEIVPHPGAPLYRMAVMGDAERGQIIFAGGGDNAYNITGVGYDGVDTKPSDRIFAWDVTAYSWVELGRMPSPSMDHRGLIKSGEIYYIIGGLDAGLNVRAEITSFKLEQDQQ